MENFIVSARKYRPTTFLSVVGQSALTNTLKNAIKNNHLAHAYLFCGPRGIGKTTCARIFAKTINCLNLTAEYEACNECESCVAFNEQRSFSIHELDAASNNSVDDIRSLIEQVRIPPQIGKYSVYIIDEVHMLSASAFNAFLKTLEEPPAHAIFILATTEKHKIIPTILSRCQIYDFNRISVGDTVKHLQYVAEKENVTVETEALNVIAQKSDGGMRDALSIFDQIVSFTEGNITYKSVIENLNVLDYEYYFKLVAAFLESDTANALLIFNDILNKGFEAHHFVSGLSAHFRDLLVCKDEKTIALLEVGASIGEAYRNQTKLCSSEFIFNALKITNDCDLDYRISKNKRLLVEIMLIRLCQLSDKKKSSDALISEEPPAPLQKIQELSPTPNPSPTSAPNPLSTKEDEQNMQEKGTTLGKVGTFSIKSQTEKVKENAESVSEMQTRNQAFTPDEFAKAWKDLMFSLDENIEKQRLKHNLEEISYSVSADNKIELTVENSFLADEINTMSSELLRFLRDKLENDTIEFAVKINGNVKKTAFTAEDRYKEMEQQNPVLGDLQKMLKLELD